MNSRRAKKAAKASRAKHAAATRRSVAARSATVAQEAAPVDDAGVEDVGLADVGLANVGLADVGVENVGVRIVPAPQVALQPQLEFDLPAGSTVEAAEPGLDPSPQLPAGLDAPWTPAPAPTHTDDYAETYVPAGTPEPAPEPHFEHDAPGPAMTTPAPSYADPYSETYVPAGTPEPAVDTQPAPDTHHAPTRTPTHAAPETAPEAETHVPAGTPERLPTPDAPPVTVTTAAMTASSVTTSTPAALSSRSIVTSVVVPRTLTTTQRTTAAQPAGKRASGSGTGPATVAPAANEPTWQRFVHRAPIDGLRAIAVLLVILFHTTTPGFRNGFVGVDVFFVLSGFLITSLLLRERLRTGRISLGGFYARRARRILPAAIAVLVVTALAYVLVAPALDVVDNRLGFVFAALYVSNWYFLGQSQDYFAQEASPSPVLHYWSLSVEEQFYLVWPLLLLVLLLIPFVRRRVTAPVLAMITLAAIWLSWRTDQDNAMLSYFGTPARAYQLLLGATLAAVALRWEQRGRASGRKARVIGQVLVVLGAAALITVGTDYGPESAWVTGIAGCLAAVVVLAGIELARSGLALAPLSNPVARLLGRWSYSMYLWHWPVIVLAGLAGILPALWYLRTPAVLAVTIVLASITWWAVERPVSDLALREIARQRTMIAAGVGLTAVCALVSAWILRVPPQTEALRASANSSDVDIAAIESSDDSSVATTFRGGTVSPQKALSVLLIGDSHAFMWWPGLKQYAASHGWEVAMVTKSACPWAEIDIKEAGAPQVLECETTLRIPAIEAATTIRPDIIILASRAVVARRIMGADGWLWPGDPGWDVVVRAGVNEFIDRLAPLSKEVVILSPVPETERPMLDCLAVQADPASCDAPAIHQPGTDSVNQIYRDLRTQHSNVTVVSLDTMLCPGEICPAEVDGVPTRRDAHHLTYAYAATMVPRLHRAIEAAGVPMPITTDAATTDSTDSSASSSSASLSP